MIAENISTLKQELGLKADLLIVSKNRSIEEIEAAYQTGHRLFAENRVQALLERADTLPKDISWHLIGHLQTNKVKYIAPFISCIQSVDSLKLLKVINEHALINGRTIDCLLQIYIAEEETKFGMDEKECRAILELQALIPLSNIRIRGLMGMASNTNDEAQIKKEFTGLKKLYDSLQQTYHFDMLSMGMSSDYRIAVACGSTIVRIGSRVFEG